MSTGGGTPQGYLNPRDYVKFYLLIFHVFVSCYFQLTECVIKIHSQVVNIIQLRLLKRAAIFF